MANRQKGEVPFEVEGQTWVLHYSTNALCEMEDLFGKSALQVAQDLESPEGVSLKSLRTVFYCGLLDHQEGVTQRQAGDLIDAIGLDKAGPLLGEAFTAAFPKAEEDDGAGKPAAQGTRRT